MIGIVRDDGAQDVVDAVNMAKDDGYRISVRSGGHQYAAASSCRWAAGHGPRLAVAPVTEVGLRE